jgi:hypothetical protein
MIRLVFFPVLLVCLLAVATAVGMWRFLGHVPSHAWSPADRRLAADLDAQRQLAECYRIGCPGAHRSVVFSCAWRLVIAEETHGADQDLTEAAKDCGALHEIDHQSAVATKQTLMHRLHLDSNETHL